MSRHSARHGAQRPAIMHKSAVTWAKARTTRHVVRAKGIRVAIQFLYRDRGVTTRRAAQRATRPATR